MLSRDGVKADEALSMSRTLHSGIFFPLFAPLFHAAVPSSLSS